MNDLSYANRANAEYLDEIFQKFQENPEAVDPEWKRFFEGVEFGRQLPPLESPDGNPLAPGAASPGTGQSDEKELSAQTLINAYRDIGHYQADLDPLIRGGRKIPELALSNFGLTEADLNRRFQAGSKVAMPNATLKEILDHLHKAYCGSIAVEFAGVKSEMRAFVIREFEGQVRQFSKEEKVQIYDDLVRTEALEKFFGSRFVGMKRFSIEGADAMIPMLETFTSHGLDEGLEEIVIGMAHRGRVNVLANFMGKALDVVFSEFDGRYDPNMSFADGDVKYHMGFSADKKTENGQVHISLAFNPSHLEAVAPVVMGMTRAKQRVRKDRDRNNVMPIIIHGDAAMIGQGVVSETFQLSELEGYKIGGTVHVVINNQVGFTTGPEAARSTYYCTDVVKQIDAPVIHVNGDDVEACIRAMNVALRFRQKFAKDIVIDLVCYRRHGHNEGDEPSFTQPLMYEKIRKHPTTKEIYGKQLVSEGVLSEADLKQKWDAEMDRLQARLEASRKNESKPEINTLQGVWTGLRRAKPEDFDHSVETCIPQDRLDAIANALVNTPESFTVHRKLVKLLDQRKRMVASDGKIDWGMGEMLAYGSLIQEGFPVRFTGQDVCRGTFSHRHAIYTDSATGETFNPLNTLSPKPEVEFAIWNSPLSEYAVLGFEYGNSTIDPRSITIWEAQFGDFANGAQIIIDQFICSAESKWQRMSGLVMLLPHGYEGQGPEHSNARPERFLQLCAQYNMQVCNLSTPAQFFHAIRRQLKRDFRKPLIIMSPKALLRHPQVVSTPKELTEGHFQEVINDPRTGGPRKVKRVVLCTGKLYYDLLAEREKMENSEDTALIRVEQLFPFPGTQILKALKGYTKLEQIIWAQEEPKNMGAYFFMAPKLQELFHKNGITNISFRYVGRSERASPAIGNPHLHKQEQEEIVKGCFT